MNQFEASIILWIQENLRGAMDGFWVFVTHLGDEGYLWIALGVVLLCFKKTRTAGVAVLLSLLLDLIVVNMTLKDLVARPRPFVVNDAIQTLIQKPRAYASFPSGHTSGSFATAFALYQGLPKKFGISALVLAGLISISRLYVGVHYPTDVLGGVVVGFLCSVGAYYIIQIVRWKIEEKRNA